jgi:shikimate kinase
VRHQEFSGNSLLTSPRHGQRTPINLNRGLSCPVIVVLLGLRGAGKSSVGSLLAADLGLPFVDLDDLTAERLGATSAGEALSRQGEPDFRRAESQALEGALASDGAVIALGGGTPTAPGARSQLERAKAAGRIVVLYLRAPAESLWTRIAREQASRPPLTALPGEDEVRALLAARDGLYRALSDHVIETAGLSPPQIAHAARALIDRPAGSA